MGERVLGEDMIIQEDEIILDNCIDFNSGACMEMQNCYLMGKYTMVWDKLLTNKLYAGLRMVKAMMHMDLVIIQFKGGNKVSDASYKECRPCMSLCLTYSKNKLERKTINDPSFKKIHLRERWIAIGKC